tara:strand:- start:174 stop:527 length:354 start_codon:yes stop_codon:yes gene_type:complete
MSTSLSDIKLPVGIIGIIIAQAFGIIWYVAQLDSTVSESEKNISELQAQHMEATRRFVELTEKMDKQLAELEKKDALIDNEMRTIMGDHNGFSDVLKTIGISGYGDTRTYGGYDNYK